MKRTILAVALGIQFGTFAEVGQAAWKAKMSFEAASKPYEHEAYNKNGHIGRKGDIRFGGLGCSGYASVVVQRMKHGRQWLTHYDHTLHQPYGDEFARKVGLRLSWTGKAALLSVTQQTRSLISAGKLEPGWYFFNIRKGVNGHVGFIQIKSDGEVAQSHYSSLKPWNGRATGNFSRWLGKSMYQSSNVKLFAIE